jgi:hypothetical protein
MVRPILNSRHNPILPGKFCSEAVAYVYQKLGFTLFNNQRKPSEVSPSDLLAHSHLELIKNVFVPDATGMVLRKELSDKHSSFHLSRMSGGKTVAGKRFVAGAELEFAKLDTSLDSLVDLITKKDAVAEEFTRRANGDNASHRCGSETYKKPVKQP